MGHNNTYKNDYYTQKAKKEGYAARSVYKLQEIHTKYLSLNKASHILDLGSAPGSWTQYLQKHIPLTAKITSVDLQELSAKIKDAPRVEQIQADFTDGAIIESLIAKGPFSYIVSDAAPLTTGNRSVDTARSELLIETIAYIAEQSLAPQGIMVAKVFQGSGMSALTKQLQAHFSKVACFKPKAVRSNSFETYFICR